jgi:kynureninase
VVVAPPAQRIAKSTSAHSTRVAAMIATRSSGRSPRASSPAPIARTRSPTSPQVSDRQPPSAGYRNASRSGVAATRSSTIRATEAARRSTAPALPTMPGLLAAARPCRCAVPGSGPAGGRPTESPGQGVPRLVSTMLPSDRASDRAEAERLDAADPLAALRDRFLVPDRDAHADRRLIYLDGNSLGMLPAASVARAHELITREWGERLIRSWPDGWLTLPARVGDLLGGALLGAAPGQVVLSDSTTVNLYKLASAALSARPGRRVVVAAAEDFPTDRYVLAGLAADRGLRVRPVVVPETGPLTADRVAAALDGDTALVVLSHVDYRSAAVADLAGITAAAHEAGALVLWDLCHSVGALPVGLDAAGADLAVGCTYKYVNAGPGAPAFLYVRREHQAALRQPIWGWFGQRDQFAMGPAYDPVPDVTRFLTGTPPVLGLALVEQGVRLLAEAGLDRLRAKAERLTALLVDRYDAWLAPLGFGLASPREPADRGAHVSLSHPDGARLCQRLIEVGNVVPDFRAPDRLRFGLAPITTRYVDVWDAMDRLRRLAAGEPAGVSGASGSGSPPPAPR